MSTCREEPTFRLSIFIAGDVQDIKRCCRKYCNKIGLCVTVAECDFVYKGGMESGAEIGLVNYPRFPLTPNKTRDIAKELALLLLIDCTQDSVLLVDAENTTWISNRTEGE